MGRLWTAAAAIVATAVLGLALWQHVMPSQFVSLFGLNPAATAELHAALGVHPAAVSAAAFAAVFRGLVVVAFTGYALLLWLTFRSPPGAVARPIARAAMAFPFVVALIMPAALSADVYTYIGYGRMAVVHGLNPHVDPAGDLIRLGDPTAPFIDWKTPSPYGPLATLMMMAAVVAAPAGSLLLPVLWFKLMTAAALLGAAVVAARIVREFDATRADAALIATALNPLLLIEGPGSAHTDIIAAVFVLLAFLALLRRRPNLAALAIGGGAAVKLIPLMLLPWVAFIAAGPGMDAAPAAARPPVLARLRTAATVGALGIVPLALLYAPFWRGARTFASMAARFHAGHGDGPGTPPIYLWIVVALYGLGSVLLVRQRRASFAAAVGTVAFVWALMTLPLLPLATTKWFPWYLTWAWTVALLRWNRAHAALVVWLLPISLALTLFYSVR